MADKPSVCCVCLVADHDELLDRAIHCWRAQTYDNCSLLIYDNGVRRYDGQGLVGSTYTYAPRNNRTIGQLRNDANTLVGCDIIVHWDSDDYSAPERIAEQVEVLQSSGADCVGYSDMLFWKSTAGQFCGAWIYRHPHAATYALGTSLCYWRKTWEGRKFTNTSKGEDLAFTSCVKTRGVSSLLIPPRMVARIHGGNTSDSYSAAKMSSEEWRRAPEWDVWCRRVM